MTKQPRTLLLFYVLVAYVALQFIWWSYLLTSMSAEVMAQKKAIIENTLINEEEKRIALKNITKKHHNRISMIVGEGSVFLGLLLFGIYRVKRSFERETEPANQQKKFMLSVTHELKTPLSAIKLNLQTLLKRKTDTETQRIILNRTNEETDRLDHLIDNVLMASRMESSSVTFKKSKVDLADFLNKFISRYEVEERVKIEIIEDAEIFGDDQLALPLIFSNLIENGLKYSDALVTIRVGIDNQNVFAEIADKGKGIPQSEKRKIFDRFYRMGDEETRSNQGTGLGLFIVKSIADKNNIQITLKDNQPSGTIFRLTFAK